MAITVLIVDDQPLLRKGFRMILDAEPDLTVVGEACDGAQAVEAAARLSPDIVLMDIRMPVMDGVEATRRVTGSRGVAPKVLILTTFDLDEYVVEAIRAGASGFLLKDVGPRDWSRPSGSSRVAMRCWRRRSPVAFWTSSGRAFPRRGDSAGRAGGAHMSCEMEVLTLVARGHSNAEIAEALYVSETTVKTHVSHVLMKLGLRDRVQAVVLAYETGIVAPGSA